MPVLWAQRNYAYFMSTEQLNGTLKVKEEFRYPAIKSLQQLTPLVIYLILIY